MNSRAHCAVAGVFIGALLVAGCSSAQDHQGSRVEPLPVLLTASEAGGEDVTAVALGQATFCGPDEWMDFLDAPPALEPEEFVSYGLDSEEASSVVLGVIPQGEYRGNIVEHLDDRITQDCLEGLPEQKGTYYNYEIDEIAGFGDNVLAFQSVQWQTVSQGGAPAPETIPEEPVETDELLIFSTSRAYGVVDKQLVVVQLNGSSIAPPSEQRLQELWDAQVAKLQTAE